ncbi:MAG: hypothetical protein OXQ94_19060 [Gemmatimonadota bacterium]|nr:hypothetical protein [Gemmatimonadota bacterium]MDE2873772.1 hypothetical protein [Gemmatimonadota bacterium]
MTTKHRIVGYAGLAVAAVLAAGCGDDEKLVGLTGEEAEALALRVGAASSMAWFEKRGDGSGEYEFVVPCPASGNVTFSGKRETDVGLESTLDVDGTQKYDACAQVVESGETITLSGTVDEGLSFTRRPLMGPTVIDIEGTWRGTVVWSSRNGDSEECEVDLALGATFIDDGWSEELGLLGGLDGTFCAIAVDAPFAEWYGTK